MILHTDIPGVVNDLIARIKAEAIADSQTAVAEALDAIGTIYWYNLLFKLNSLVSAIELYQGYLIDGDLQDLIDEIGTIWFYDLYRKVALLIETTELIETL